MGKAFSIGYKLTADAGATGDVTIFTIGAARTFTLQNIAVHFPSGQAYKLAVSIFRGIMKIAPKEGSYCSDHSTIQDDSDEVFQSGERIIAHYENSDTENAQSCFILLSGCIE
jgi:hypothetical protein